MVRKIKPLQNKSDFNKLVRAIVGFNTDEESLRFLSFTLLPLDEEDIIRFTENHEEMGIEYIVYEQDGLFTGILAYKKNKFEGFELYLLGVDSGFQKRGIGQLLITECIRIAKLEEFKCINCSVFADNKNMLRLLIKNDFRPLEIQHHARADGMDMLKLRKCLKKMLL